MSPMNQQAPFFPNGVPGLPAGAGAAPFGAGAAYVPGMPPELASLVAAGRIEPLTRGSIGPGGGGGGGSDGEPGGRDRSSPFGEFQPSHPMLLDGMLTAYELPIDYKSASSKVRWEA